MIINTGVAEQAAEHLSENDPILAPIIKKFGICTIRPHADYYRELAGSIISQQLSVKAAHAIEKRFCALFKGEKFPEPAAILEKDIERLRSAGLSRAKAAYVLDLASHVVQNKIEFDKFGSMTNQEIIDELTAVKGIGEWTAHMFLMFSMGRTDVLPCGDLGIRNGIQKLYGLKELPGKPAIEQMAKANNWHPHESIACWYVWQSLDNAPKT